MAGNAAGTIDQEKFDRLKAVAQGGKAGLDQYDAAKASLDKERATMAAGLAHEAYVGGYAGQTTGSPAPAATAGLLKAGLDPYQTALAGDRAAFSRNIAEGGLANQRYLDQVKAAIGPSLAARSRGGGGGGSGGGLGGLSDTQLRNALIAAAAKERSAHVAEIHASEQRAAEAANQASIIDLSDPKYAEQVGAIRWSSENPQHTAAAPATPRARAGIGQVGLAGGAPVDPSEIQWIAKKAQDRVHALQNLLAVRQARQQRIEGLPIVPEAQQIGLAAGVDPLKVSALLGPAEERTYRNAIKSGLPVIPKAEAATPAPVPFDVAAKAAGISPARARAVLGIVYRTGEVDSKGNAKTGNLSTDIIDTARDMAKRGFDYNSFEAYLRSHLPKAVRAKHPDAIKFSLAVGYGFFRQAAAQQPVADPYQRYYEQQYPLVPAP